jgi:hypothetical protein
MTDLTIPINTLRAKHGLGEVGINEMEGMEINFMNFSASIEAIAEWDE